MGVRGFVRESWMVPPMTPALPCWWCSSSGHEGMEKPKQCDWRLHEETQRIKTVHSKSIGFGRLSETLKTTFLPSLLTKECTHRQTDALLERKRSNIVFFFFTPFFSFFLFSFVIYKVKQCLHGIVTWYCKNCFALHWRPAQKLFQCLCLFLSSMNKKNQLYPFLINFQKYTCVDFL